MPNHPPTWRKGKPMVKPKRFERTHDDMRGNRHQRGYTNQWYKLRQWYIQANPLCAHCLAQGITQPAQDVDHIVPISQGGDNLDPDNLQSLCRPCHNRKTRAQARNTHTIDL
jgi:5-methylcytosine-specific restriction protein A